MAVSITSGTYVATTGIISIVLAAPGSFAAGNFVTLSGLTGTGSFSNLDGTWTAIAPTSGTTLTLQGPFNVAPLTITGGSADFLAVVAFDQFGEQPRRARSRQLAGIFAGGEQGNEGLYAGGPPITNAPWQFDAQQFQPPRFRYAQRIAALLAPDADFNDNSAPLKIQFARGWEVQNFQPPSAFTGGGRGRQFTAAIARGDDGTIAVFLPPWTMAQPATSFPNIQSNPRAAIPTYDAGPQPGSIFSQPNIITGVVLKAAPGNLIGISVVSAGSAAGAAYDCTSVGAAVAAGNPGSNEIWSIPMTLGYTLLDWPCQHGIVVIPGAGQVIAVKWN